MEYYNEPSKKIPVAARTEVLVVGGGPAGIGAALSAARGGAKTMIIEQQGALGGVSTSGLMSHWTGNCESGIYKEVLYRSAILNEGKYKDKLTIYIDHEKLKLLYLDMLAEAGVRIQLYTFCSGAVVEGGKVKGIICESKSGREVIEAQTVIDASGDGDAAFYAGCEYYKGRESDNKMQPVTLMLKFAGVDTQRAVYLPSFESTCQTPKGELQALAKRHLTHPAGHVLLYHSTQPGMVFCNMTNVTEIDGTNPRDLTRAEITARKQAFEIERFLREFAPGYENCFLTESASYMGVRETRHFKGVQQLTDSDILDAKVYDNWVVKDAYFNFDVHNIKGAGLDETGVQHKFEQKKGYTIPYGCLLPEGMDGLLLSGRNISANHMAHSNMRAMPICLGTGEAAGTAAALAIKENCALSQVNVQKIQQIVDKSLQNGIKMIAKLYL